MATLQTVRRALTVKRAALLAVVALVLAGVGAALRPDALEVETAVVRRTPLRVTVDAEGMTRVRDRYVLAAPVTGRLERLAVDEGDAVRAGDVVARIAPAPLDEPAARQARARLDAARALEREAATRVRLAEAASAQAARDAVRARRLHEAGAVAARALEEAELLARGRSDDVAAARAHAAAAAAEVAQATAALLHVGGGAGAAVPVRTPAAGRVLRLADRSERVIAAGTTIAEVGDTRGLEVVVDVLSSDAAVICPGMPASLEGWGGDAAVAGTVRLVEPAATTRVSALGVDEQRVDVLVEVPDPPPSLGDGFRVDARILVWSADSVLAIPASALVRAGSGWGAFVVRSGRAVLRPIEVGRMGGGAAQILAGLAEGDVVIVFPSDQVRDGGRVAARR
jgi:HlyD family secretion protein